MLTLPTRRFLPFLLAVVLVTLTAAACATAQREGNDADRIAALEQSFSQRLQQMEQRMNQRLDALEAKTRQLPAQRSAPTVEEEKTAAGLLGEANAMLSAGNIDGAREKLTDLLHNHSRTRAGRRARSLSSEVEVIGKAVPAALAVEKWYQGEEEGAGSLSDSGATLLVFWEAWCPHCQREVPKLEEVYQRYKARGLHVVGLTKLTRGTTDDRVRAFLADRKIDYPIAKEDGTLSRTFNVRGIPAAAVVKAGKIVWRGHPTRLTDAMIEGWL
jgi:thiol-disulfide isomerase/thioredoxin